MNAMKPTTVPQASAGADTRSSSSDVELKDDVGEQSVIARILKIPKTVQDYLFSDALSDVHKKIFARHGVDGDVAGTVYYTELQVFLGELDIEDLFDMVWARLPWPDSDEARAKALCIDILGNVFLPAQAFIGDVTGAIVELGGAPGSFQVKPLEVRQLSYADGVTMILSLLGKADLAVDDMARLEHIIESRLRDVRDESETTRMLTKERKTGGLSLPSDQAERIMEAMRNEMRMTKFVEQVIATVHHADAHQEQARGGEATHEEWTPEAIKAVYMGSAEEQKELVTRLEMLKNETGGDHEALRERLYEAMYPPIDKATVDRWGVIATVISLMQANGLIKTIIDDQRFRELAMKYVEAKGGYDIEKIRRAPAGREGMNIFLQLVFRAFAGLNENDSARYGLRVITMLKKTGETQYADLVAFDLDRGSFAWALPIDLE